MALFFSPWQSYRELNSTPTSVDTFSSSTAAPSKSILTSAATVTANSQTSQEKESSESPSLLGAQSQRALLKPIKPEPDETESALAAPAPLSSQMHATLSKRKQPSTGELPTGGDENGKKKHVVCTGF
jgi:hypothetical protein